MEINREMISSLEEVDVQEGRTIDDLIRSSQTPIPDPDEWLENIRKYNVVTTTIDKVINWGRTSSLWPLTCFTACCVFEFIQTSASRFDISRFGMEVLRASPRQADLLIASGTLTWKMAPQVKRIYDQMAEPKWVMAMGACAISGGIFKDSYSVVPGYNRLFSIDAYVPGCPPRPEALLSGLEMLRSKMKRQSIMDSKRIGHDA